MVHVQPTRGVFDRNDLAVLRRAYLSALTAIGVEGLGSDEDRRDLAKLLMCLAADLTPGPGLKGYGTDAALARQASRIMIDLNAMPLCA